MKNVSIATVALCLLAHLCFPPLSDAHDALKPADLSKMSFEELMAVKISVPAALTQMTQAETPASVTVITAADIQLTPARNIYDLIEVYVPGAIWMNYEEGPQLGVRGLISNRNTRYLLRVNGRTMNNTAHFGAMSELEQWNLSDIDKIEIIRGPGSVTYGPGAIAGVINIVTKNGVNSPGLHASSGYASRYESRGGSVSYGTKSERYSLYGHASFRRTPGYNAPHFLGTNSQEAGYIGETIDLDKEPLDYFADFHNDPQVKLFVESNFLQYWKVWARYTQQGSTWRGNETKTDFDGVLLNLHSLRSRQWAATLEYERDLSQNISLSMMSSYSSSDAQRQKDKAIDPDPDHVLNKQVDFSESDVLLHGVITWQMNDWAELAVGAEFDRYHYGAPWGKGSEDMQLGDNGIIVNDANSNAIRAGVASSADRDSTAIFVGNGWNTNSYAMFSEANVAVRPWLKLLFSGRVDKSTYTNSMFSPRVALIANPGDGHHLKLIAQKSVRRNTASQVYTEASKGLESNTETLQGLELIYTRFIGSGWQFNMTGMRNSVDVIAWDGDDNVTEPLGRLKLYGVEADVQYTWEKGKAGASYSFIKQIDWDLADGEIRSGISYSDYNQPVGTGLQTGVGNDLANWPNQAIKFFGRLSLSDRMTLHVDMRALWDFQGAKDGLIGLSNAVVGTTDEAAVEASLQNVSDVNAFEVDFRTNMSAAYLLSSNLRLQLSVRNLIGANNYRYSYDNGNKKPAAKGVRFTVEPRVFAMQIEYDF